MFDDFVSFRKMITPTIIQVLFWIGVAAVVISGFGVLMNGIRAGGFSIVVALISAPLTVIVGVLIVRIGCELLIVIFQINNTLTEIKNLLERK